MKIEKELVDRKALKFYLTVNLELERISAEGVEVTSEPYLHSLPFVVLESSDLDEEYQTASDRLKELLDVFQGQGSGFSLKSLLECTVNVATYDVVGGSSFIELPAYIRNKMACVNIKNTDDEFCFLYSLSYVRNPPNSNVPNRPTHYKKDLKNFDISGLKFPLPVKQIPKFEKQNEEFSVNVYALDETKEKSRENQVNLYPVYTSPHRKRKHHANLLLIRSGDKSHYVEIKSLSRLLKGRVAGHSQSFVCRYCLYSFEKEHSLIAHEDMCSQHPAQKVVYPTLGENILKFKNFGNTLEVPFTIFADFESILLPTSDPKKYNKHQPSAVSCLTVSAFPEYNNQEMFVYTGEDAVQQFFAHLDREKSRIDEILNRDEPMKPLTPEELKEHNSAKTRKNCGVKFDEGVFKRVFHHEHTFGRYLFACCSRCNLLLKYKQTVRKTKNKEASFEVPVFFHNLTNYDSHLILKHVQKTSKKDKMTCIGTSSEKLLTFTYRGFKFLDSCNFLKASLAVLTENLLTSGIDKFEHTRRVFRNDEQFELVLQKGVCPYSYIDSFERFSETQLPPKEAFFNDLTDSHISDEEYERARKIWSVFGCQTLLDYHTVHVKTDTCLLSDIVTAFCKLSMQDYGLDPKHYITLPSYSFDCMLRFTSIQLELICEPDMALFVESSIRGGISVVTSRLATANNPLVEGYDVTKPTSYVNYFDAVNLYGASMCKLLPVGDFRFLSDEEIASFDITKVDPNGSTGYMVQADILYPLNSIQHTTTFLFVQTIWK